MLAAELENLFLKTPSQEEILKSLKIHVGQDEMDTFLQINSFAKFQIECRSLTNEVIYFDANFLFYAAMYNYSQLVNKLLLYSICANTGTKSNNPAYDNSSPLMVACEKGHTEVVNSLLNANANILHRNSFGLNVLMKVNNQEMFDIICNNALKVKGHLYQLIYMKEAKGLSAYHYFILSGCDELAEKIMSYAFALLVDTLSEASEETALIELNQFISVFGSETLSCPLLPYQQFGYETLLHYACRNNMPLLATLLLDLKVSVDEGVKFNEHVKPSEPLHEGSPLTIACYHNHVEIVKLLFKYNINLLRTARAGMNLFAIIKSVEVYKILAEEAEKRQCLQQFIQGDIYAYHCQEGNIEILEELIKIANYHTLTDLRKLLTFARISSWKYPEKSERFADVCSNIRQLIKKPPSIELNENALPRISDTYSNLLKYSVFSNMRLHSHWEPLLSKVRQNDAVLRAIAKFHEVLLNPLKSVQYLKFLDKELLRYYDKKYQKKFPLVNQDSFQFQIIDGLSYPIPKDDYVIINKKCALQELLILLFKSRGLAKNSYKWIGFMPKPLADYMAKIGDFFTESSYGIGLFHGKLSHMIQLVILIYAIEAGDIDLTYDILGHKYTITLIDILQGFIDITDADDEALWTKVRDYRVNSHVEFSDPHRLNSIIMRDGSRLGLPVLSSFMIDSFCKGFLQFKTAIKESTAFKNIDTQTFMEQLNDLELRHFVSTSALIQYAIDKAVSKINPGEKVLHHSCEHALISKSYNQDNGFEPAVFNR